ncbi:membrane protein YczE [Zhihengliuella alba]
MPSVPLPCPSGRPRARLVPMTPLQQLRAPRKPLRLLNLAVGIVVLGAGVGLFVRAGLGLSPWDVLHQGLSRLLPISFGTVIVLLGLLILLLWIPLRQWPGLGTLVNTFAVGPIADLTITLLPPIHGLAWQAGAMALATVLAAVGTTVYIGAQFGGGPRDGLMTGLHFRTGLSVRAIRTIMELTALAVGWLLGGVVGLGTVVFALSIGPLCQLFFRWTVVDVERRR